MTSNSPSSLADPPSSCWLDRPVLVTGATGLIGGWLVRRLLESGADVVCLVRDWVPQSELVRAGLVERAGDAGDRRVVRNALTPAGRELIDRPWETRRAVLASALRRASPEDRAAIARGLEALCRVLETSGAVDGDPGAGAG